MVKDNSDNKERKPAAATTRIFSFHHPTDRVVHALNVHELKLKNVVVREKL